MIRTISIQYFHAIFSLLFLLPSLLYAQQVQRVTLNGTIRDGKSGETLVGASIRVQGATNLGTAANSYGFFSLSLSPGQYDIVFSSLGYQSTTLSIDLQEDRRLNVELMPNNVLDEVEIVADNGSRERLESPKMGVQKLEIREMNRVPVIFGERDVLKVIQLLPGVMSGGEGTSGFFVRGGAADQNLVLLDEAVVYNASHLLGFFSSFNSDAIKGLELYKGGMPAQYGGRLASVLDVSMLDGNNQQYGAEGGIGLIASRLKVDGPIVKGKGSFMVSGRRTYVDQFLRISPDSTVNSSKLYFYDLNMKANYQLNANNTLYLSGYFGKDLLGYSNTFGFDWGNATGTLRWNHLFSDKLFSNTSLIYSDFKYNVNVFNDNNDFRIASNIKNANLKQDFQYFASNASTLRFGVHVLRQQISPAGIEASNTSDINSLTIDRRIGHEVAAYLSHEWKPRTNLSFLYGLRMSSFLQFGPGTFYTFDSEGDPTSSEEYRAGKLVQTYFNMEPRFSVNYMMGENTSLKASYNRNTQNLHQLSNSISSLPTDAWVMSSNIIRPQIADQVSVGYYRNFLGDRYEFSTEAYYKDMQRQIDYRNGADLQANEYVESELIFGKGRAYGLEFYVKKNRGRLNGWLSYTLSRSERRFDGINEGRWFAARQDRTHDVAVVAMYKISDRWDLSGNFVFQTGNAVTFPSGKYDMGGKTLFYYTERNAHRMPNYHRMDLGATWTGKDRADRRFRSSWTFGLYNVYNRQNAYIIDFRDKKGSPGQTEAYQVSLFGIIPSVTWNFRF
ncbi:TonB-dependent receptor [Olivibacter sitiensis]|uniref:TonB-dependent receptor n=1 Tax=Olivibacter sitiensis TaxID=376470 RepID=UPI0004032F57|nr:TonB-dependent receptor [Olivibacter sitiensis]